MALTSLVGPNGWTQLTATAGGLIGVSTLATGNGAVVFFIVGATDPGSPKVEPAAGDDAIVLSEGGLTSVGFFGLSETDHVWARSSRGNQTVYVSEKITAE